METLIKELFESLHDVSEDGPWHDKYKETFERARARAERVREGKAISYDTDKDLLRTLIYEIDNGIASVGMSILSEENFKRLLETPEFMNALNDFARTPNADTYMAFYQTWKDLSSQLGFSFAKARANRLAAAFTDSVSSTADEGKFKSVYNWLVRRGVITDPIDIQDYDWFTRNQHAIKALRNIFAENLKNETTDKYWLNMFVWFLWERFINNPERLKKQVIKYGPPGTGKTYTAKRDALREIALWKANFGIDSQDSTPEQLCFTMQFHPSLSYEDFIEGLRPVKTTPEGHEYQLKLTNGVFKELCKKAGRWEIDLYNMGLMPDRSTSEGKLATSPLQWKVTELKEYADGLLEQGPHWEFIVTILKNHLDRYGDCTLEDLLPPYFLIIDEINRAELSRVFGELMYCLEYRGTEGCVATQYARLNDDQDAMFKVAGEARFFVPTNLHIIGTMNTIDRSVESFDFALRRRFHWQHVTPNENVARAYLLNCPNETWTSLLTGWKNLNRKIAEEKRFMGPDFQIGHSYLMNLPYSPDTTITELKKSLWSTTIGPLIEEYLRGTEESIEPYKKAFGL